MIKRYQKMFFQKSIQKLMKHLLPLKPKLDQIVSYLFKNRSNKLRNSNSPLKQFLRRNKVLPLILQHQNLLLQLKLQKLHLRRLVNQMYKKRKTYKHHQLLQLMVNRMQICLKKRKLWQWLKLKWQA